MGTADERVKRPVSSDDQYPLGKTKPSRAGRAADRACSRRVDCWQTASIGSHECGLGGAQPLKRNIPEYGSWATREDSDEERHSSASIQTQLESEGYPAQQADPCIQSDSSRYGAPAV